MRPVIIMSLLALGTLIGCRAPHSRQPPEESTAVSTTDSPARRTTNPTLAVDNLNGKVRELSRRWERTHDGKMLAALVDALLARAHYLGRLEDLSRADELSELLLSLQPKKPDAHLRRAHVHSALHRFDEAMAELRRTEKLGLRGDRVEQLRATIYLARGDAKRALAVHQKAVDRWPNPRRLANLAVSHVALQNFDQADALFQKSWDAYRDVSPFFAAWLSFQRGRLWEKAGDTGRAREYYTEAVGRMPHYPEAVMHLAEIEASRGELVAAIARLRALRTTSDDPEVLGLLATLLSKKGEHAEAKKLASVAEQRFDELLLAHPNAFLNHGAQFFLHHDAPRALTLAERDLVLRQTPEGYALAINAALLAGNAKRACHWADQATAGPVSREVYAVSWRAFSACDRQADADRLDQMPY